MVTKKFLGGIFLGALGVVLFSSKAVMVKIAYNYKVDAITMLFLRMFFSFPFYIAIVYLYRNEEKEGSISFKKKEYAWVVFFGFVGYYLASFFDFIGLIYIKASLERIILFVYPTIVILLNSVFLKQPITKSQTLAILLSYIGIVIAFSDEVDVDNIYLGGFFILLSAVTYASYLVGSGWLIPKFGVVKFTAYAMLVSCFCVFIHFSIIWETNLFNLPWEVYGLGLLIAIFATVIPSFLVSTSIKIINSSNFAIVAGIGPISTIILASIFLNESLTLVQFFGSLLVVTGIIIASFKSNSNS